MDESDVGILCYISQLPGFRGILKQRYSDFIVNEVDLDGNVVHLTSLDTPTELVEESKVEVSDQSNRSYTSEVESFRSLAGDIDADLFKDFTDQLASGDKNNVQPIVLSPNSDKSQRTAIHNFFKDNFKSLVTDTVDGPDASSKCIRVRVNSGNDTKGRHSRKRKERGDRPFDIRGSENWSEHDGKFLRFHLYKENKDTQEALGVIGKMLGVQPKSFGFAGTKDKRAVTTQRVTVFKQHASKLAALNKRLIGMKVGNFCHVKEGLFLGQLLGNRFTVTLRGVVADSEDTIKEAAKALGRHGFINYFGLQRFGSGAIPTHIIGAALFRGEWKTAVNMILDPREGEREDIAMVRKYYKESDDIEGTLRQLPRHLVAERAILQVLKKFPGNYLQALNAIPRTLRTMYVHSYQSYLWNHAASMRLQKYGTDSIVLGDLVYCKVDDNPKVMGVTNLECEDGICNDTNDGNLDEISGTDIPEIRNKPVKVVTEEDILSGNFTIDDVILPLPGSRIVYPMNDIAEVYQDLSKKDGISLTESSHNVKEFSITSMTGSYRLVLQKPKDFEWELLTYSDGTIPLAETDLDKIAQTKALNVSKEEDPTNGNNEKELFNCFKQSESYTNGDVELVPQGESKQPQLALKLGFTLPASCYATMVIRELLKTSTSVAFHKSLN